MSHSESYRLELYRLELDKSPGGSLSSTLQEFPIFACKSRGAAFKSSRVREFEGFPDDSIERERPPKLARASSGAASWLLWLNPQDCHWVA